MRAKLDDDITIDGTVLKSLCRPIASVIMPINSKVLISVQSTKISATKCNAIRQFSPEEVKGFNHILFHHANRNVVCENKDYLRGFINATEK